MSNDPHLKFKIFLKTGTLNENSLSIRYHSILSSKYKTVEFNLLALLTKQNNLPVYTFARAAWRLRFCEFLS